MKYLRTSSSIKDGLHQIFTGPGTKWAVVAFVGYGALDQLPPEIEGLSVICWPKPGATSPDGIRRLQNAGIRVYFCEKLHTKLFWSEDRGVIIGSANLSRNALGNSDQHEFAVYIDDASFDINAVLSALSYTEVTESALNELDVAHTATTQKDPDADEVNRRARSFIESRRDKFPRKWKLSIWNELRDTKEPIKQAVMEKTGKSRWINDNDVDPNIFEIGDFVLQVHVGEDCVIQRANCKWLRVDLVTSAKGSPPAIVQLTPLENGPPPPFKIDSQFSKYFKAAYNDSKWEEIVDDKMTINKEFLQKIQLLYKIG